MMTPSRLDEKDFSDGIIRYTPIKDTASDDEQETLEPDEYIEQIGQCGFFQIRTQIIFFLFMIPLTSQIFITYYVVHDPPWKCKNNSSVCLFKDIINSQDSRFLTKCGFPRKEWEFTKPEHYSLVTQFDLVCGMQYYALAANSLVFVGWGIGGFILSYMSDRYGRKRILFPVVITSILSTMLSVVANSLMIFIITRLIIGIALSGGGVTIFVLAAEIVGPKFRALSCTLIWFYFTASMVLLTLSAYIAQDWKLIETINTLPFIVLLLTWSCFPESIRWLRLNGMTEKAELLLHKIAKANNRPMPNARLRIGRKIPEVGTFFNLFYPWTMLSITIIHGLTWCVCGLTYFTVSLASGDLGGGFYRDFIFTSVVEIPGNIAVIVFCDCIGRKKAVISHIYLASLSLAIVAFIPFSESTHVTNYIRLVAGMIGKYATTCYFNSLYIWSAELYPTVIRTQAVGFMLVASRVGATFAPFMITSLKYINNALPFIILALLNLFTATINFYLKETRHKPIVDTIEESLQTLCTEELKKTKVAN